MYSLLAENAPSKFVAISSGAGSIADGAAMPVKMLAYGASKAGENYLVRKIHFEFPNLGMHFVLTIWTLTYGYFQFASP